MKNLIKFSLSAALLLLAAGVQAQDRQTYDITWSKVKVDASRTGVTRPNTTNVKEALGTVENGIYTAPNGNKFDGGSTAKVAQIMIDAQPSMAPVKEVIGHTTHAMAAEEPQSELSNWFVDELMVAANQLTGKPIDIGISNFGGIRIDMPEGDVTVDDIMSMFPFHNTVCVVTLKGSSVREIFERMAAHHMEVVGGVQLVIKDHKLQSIKVGGQPLDDNRTYNVATINFLLDGGDNVAIGKNALDLTITDVYVYDVMLPYVRSLTAAGKNIESKVDDRVVILN